MLIEIPASFSSKYAAQAALKDVRKTYRVALRGAVVIGPDYFCEFKIHAPLGETGFSVGELAAVLRANVTRGTEHLAPSEHRRMM